MEIRENVPAVVRDYLTYHETIQGHSRRTAAEYALDLRTFFRFVKIRRGLVPEQTPYEEICVLDVDLPFLEAVTLSEVYDFLGFLAHDRPQQPNSPDSELGVNANTRARKVACLRSFFKYLTTKSHKLQNNPVQDLDAPKIKKSLPRYLSLDECNQLLSAVQGDFQARDYCILMLFLNCGLRISELAGLNLTDVREDTLRVTGKGNKERIVYLNGACQEAIRQYLSARIVPDTDVRALFTSQFRRRISVKTIQHLVKKRLLESGLDASRYSAHKLRHTAATLMLQNGVDIRTLQEVLGHEHLNTTQIYTHIENANLRAAANANPLGRRKAHSDG